MNGMSSRPSPRDLALATVGTATHVGTVLVLLRTTVLGTLPCMADESVPTSGGVPITPEVLDRLADEAEAGYDPARLRSRYDSLGGLVFRAVVVNVQEPLLTLANLYSWVALPAAVLGTAPNGPLQRWATIAADLFSPGLRRAGLQQVEPVASPEVIAQALHDAADQERCTAQRILMAVSTYLTATALELSDRIEQAPASRVRPEGWEQALGRVASAADRFQSAVIPERLEQVLLELLQAPV